MLFKVCTSTWRVKHARIKTLCYLTERQFIMNRILPTLVSTQKVING